ncbi:hypothetical protein ABPG74_020538 [Tetrahymena malaccensis]
MDGEADMEQIEADFGINLKDIPIQDIPLKLGDVEYFFAAKKGLWKTKVENQNDEKFEMVDKETGYEKKKKRIKDEGENLSIQEMQSRITKIEQQIKSSLGQINDLDQNIQNARERLKEVKQENNRLTEIYIDEHLETELLVLQAQKIIQIQKDILEQEKNL